MPHRATDPAEATPSPESTIAATLGIVGDRWTLLVLRSIFRGAHRFGEIQADLGIARNLLTDRLGRLVDHGILVRVPYQQRPRRHEYRLSDSGRELSPVLIALMQWGDRWCADGAPPTVLVHEPCATALELSVRCPRCDVDVDATAIRSRPGPGQRATA